MEETVTYSLKNRQTDSGPYYKDIAVFTAEVVREVKNITQPLVEAFRRFILQTGAEKLRTQEEYMFELLTLGVLWRVYSGDALGLGEFPRQLLTGLADLRKKGGRLKPGIDFLRGILATVFLSPDPYDRLTFPEPELEHLTRLINWLAAAGDFHQEVKRLKQWEDFLGTLSAETAANHLATAITTAAWFETRSEEVLGKYTPHVERYLNEVRPGRYWKEDVIFCGKRRVEYHLNMVGAEIMNRAFRKAFMKTGRKVVLLPGCMRALPQGECKAEETSPGYRCTGCTPGCRVRHAARLGDAYGFSVFIVPHQSSLFPRGTASPLADGNTGVIGVSCVAPLTAGGWMLKELDIPAQCVLLDYCGCKNHWHAEGIPTDMNMEQLLKMILGAELPGDRG